MNTIKLMLIAAVVALAQGCSTLPRALEANANDVQKIVWNKAADASAFRDQNGVCHTFARDTKAALHDLGQQVKACFNGTLPEKLVKVADLMEKSRLEVVSLFAESERVLERKPARLTDDAGEKRGQLFNGRIQAAPNCCRFLRSQNGRGRAQQGSIGLSRALGSVLC